MHCDGRRRLSETASATRKTFAENSFEEHRKGVYCQDRHLRTIK